MEINDIYVIVVSIIAGASAFLKAAELIVKYTKTTKDDEVVAFLINKFGIIGSILNKLALNPSIKKGTLK